MSSYPTFDVFDHPEMRLSVIWNSTFCMTNRLLWRRWPNDQMTKWPTADFKKSLMPDVYCCIPSLEYLRGAFLWIILEVSSFMVDPGSSSPCVHWNSKLDDLGLRWSRSSLNWRVSATCTSGRWEIETPNPMLCFRGEKNHGSNRKSRTRPCK